MLIKASGNNDPQESIKSKSFSSLVPNVLARWRENHQGEPPYHLGLMDITTKSAQGVWIGISVQRLVLSQNRFFFLNQETSLIRC